MNRKRNSAFALIAVAGMVLGASQMVNGAPAAAGGGHTSGSSAGAPSSGGGEHAASAGGEHTAAPVSAGSGVHESAPTQSAPHAGAREPAAEHSQAISHAPEQVQRSGASVQSSGQRLTPPGETQHPVTGTGQTTVNTFTGRSQNRINAGATNNRFYNPYRQGVQNNGSVGVYNSYPWWPFSYGYNSGWYGYNNASNYQYPFFVPDGNGYINDENPQDNPTPTQNPVAPVVPTAASSSSVATSGAAPLQSAANSAGLQAQVTNAVDKSPALVNANNTVAVAQSALDTERERVLAALRNKPEYQRALASRHEASRDVNAAKSTNGTASPAVVDAATAKLDASDEVTKMEEQAVATDPAAAAAKGRLDQAIADRNSLRAQLTAQAQTGH